MTAVGEKLCDRSDVVSHYHVILGRDPESAAVVEEAMRQPLTLFVRGGLASAEFHDSVVSRLANGRRLPHERLSARPAPDQISWLAPHIELGSDVAAMLGLSRSWEDFFRLLCADVNFRRLVPALRDSELLSTLPRRLLLLSSGAPDESASGPPLPRRRRRDPEVSRDIVIVTGMHRSGTSLCANLMSLLGVNMSDEIESTPDNPSGHWERPELTRFHDRVLQTLGRDWCDKGHALALPSGWLSQPEVQSVKSDIEDWLDERLSSSVLQGFKDPRVARLVPLWDQICAELRLIPRYVFCVRHPNQVARSLLRRDGISKFDAAYRWMVYNSAAVRALGDRPLCIVPYDEWFIDSSLGVRRLASFVGLGGSLDNATLMHLMIRTIDPRLRHDAPPPEADTVAMALYRHLVESAPSGRLSASARQASEAFVAVDEFMQPLLDPAYAERGLVEHRPDPARSAQPYDSDMVRLAGRLAANIKLYTEALGSVLDKLAFDSRAPAAGGVAGPQVDDSNPTPGEA